MKQTQRTRIIKLLKRGWISPLDALKECGTMKLATRAGEIGGDHALLLQGYSLESKWSPDKAYKLYRLTRKPATRWADSFLMKAPS